MPRSAPDLLPFAGHGVLVAPDRLKLLNPAAAEIQDARAAGIGEEGILAALVAAGLAESAARAHLRAVAQELADLEQPPTITPFPPQLPPAIYQAPPPLPATAWSGCVWLCGRCYGVRTDDPILAATLVPLLAHLLFDQPVEIPPQATLSLILDPGQNTRTLWRGAHPLATGLARDTALPTLLMELGECAYRGSDWLAALHAGGVHDGRRALVLPALGGTGKTTLTAALLAAGLGYLSDDVIPLQRSTCEAMALPLPLRVRAASLPLLRASFPGLEQRPTYGLPGQVVHLLSPPPAAVGPAERTYPVAALIFLARDGGRVQPALDAVSPVEALQRLLASDALLRRPLIAADIAELLVWLERTPAHCLRYGALAPAVAGLLGLLE